LGIGDWGLGIGDWDWGSHTPAACSFPGANARSWAGLGEARPAQILYS